MPIDTNPVEEKHGSDQRLDMHPLLSLSHTHLLRCLARSRSRILVRLRSLRIRTAGM